MENLNKKNIIKNLIWIKRNKNYQIIFLFIAFIGPSLDVLIPNISNFLAKFYSF